ncbi:MAG: TlyA family rRNA (cytidine-2'-O)-methyltransferase, partial [Cyanobacteria bacterium P01_A01_bin.17]
AIATVLTTAETIGWHYAGLTWSPCPGPAGNIEFLLWMQMEQQTDRPEQSDLIQLAKTAQQQLFKAS